MKRPTDVSVELLIGNPGVGKTRYVVDTIPEAQLYHHEPGDAWFDGYSGQPYVLMDDFVGAASGMRLDKCLRFLDRYRVRLPVKGSFTYLVSKTVYLTSNIHPYAWYKWTGRELQYLALKRRIMKVWIFEEDGTIVLLSDENRDRFFGNDFSSLPIPGTEFGSWKMPIISLNE